MTEQRAETAAEQVTQLVELLDVETIDVDLYRGARKPGGIGRVFGGQVIAQALQAAQRSVEGKDAHSLHAYFMRPGNEDFPIIYRVVRDFDGGSFANRRVIAQQQGVPILNMIASFQRPEDGLSHQTDMPDVPGPDGLRSEAELRAEMAGRSGSALPRPRPRPRPIEFRPCSPVNWFKPQQHAPVQNSWFRTVAPLPDDPALHRAVLSYATDMMLLSTAIMPHGVNWRTRGLQSASLDHAVWLHEPMRADDWLLYTTDSPWAGHARGFNRGRIYSRDGRLVASVAQEGLMRMRG